jgi:hypothetical protein
LQVFTANLIASNRQTAETCFAYEVSRSKHGLPFKSRANGDLQTEYFWKMTRLILLRYLRRLHIFQVKYHCHVTAGLLSSTNENFTLQAGRLPVMLKALQITSGISIETFQPFISGNAGPSIEYMPCKEWQV